MDDSGGGERANGSAVAVSPSGRQGPRRRTVLLSGLAGLAAVGVPTGLYLTRSSDSSGLELLTVIGTPVPFIVGVNATGPGSGVRAVAFHPSGRLLAVFHDDATATLWDVDNPSSPVAVAGHGTTVTGWQGVFTPDGHNLITLNRDATGATPTLWDVADPTHASVVTTLGGPASTANSLALRPDGRVLAVAATDATAQTATISLWDVTNRAAPTLMSTTTPPDYPESSLAFSHNGNVLMVGSDDASSGSSGLWNTSDPRHPTPLGAFTADSGNGAGSGTFASGGRVVVTTGGQSGVVRTWNVIDPTRPTLLAAFADHATRGSAAEVNGLAISPTGHTLATAGPDARARLWNITDPPRPALLATLTGHVSAVTSVAFSPNGQVLATTSIDRTVRLWNASGL